MAPVGIGLSLFIAHLLGIHWTGASLNPVRLLIPFSRTRPLLRLTYSSHALLRSQARSIGPAVVDRQFDGNFWVYIVGPFLGAIIAAGFYKRVSSSLVLSSRGQTIALLLLPRLRFIKFMQYEMVNSDQDRDSAAPAVVKEKKIAAAALAAGLVPPSPSAMAKIGELLLFSFDAVNELERPAHPSSSSLSLLRFLHVAKTRTKRFRRASSRRPGFG